MSLIADVLRPLSSDGLARVRGRIEGNTLADLVLRPRVGFDFDFDPLASAITLGFRDPAHIGKALAGDCIRMAAACFQSMISVPQEIAEKEATPWALVKLYYAAFYAAQCIMRICGESCSYFYAAHASVIDEVRRASGKAPSYSVRPGLYHCRTDDALTALTCVKESGATFGGHESFWKMFGRWINQALRKLTALPDNRERQQVILALEGLKDILCEAGRNHDWLSHIRNDLQYRHDFDVWFPARLKDNVRASLSRSARQWKLDPMEIDLDVSEPWPLAPFVAGCAFLVALCREKLIKLGDTVGRNSFIRFGALPR